ncbi:MAG: aminoacyl-tRNA hydrolase, partial [Phycisphaerae bacterium]
MKLIVGLGNPGPKYDKTRHNVGFAVIDELASRHGISMATEKFHGWYGKGTIAGEAVVLLKPTTFMNRSGQAVQAAGKFFKLTLDDLLVILDDLALPVGRLRMRASGTAGGHNGVKDIIERLGSKDWCRLRVGIGEPLGSTSTYVLSRFTGEDVDLIDAGIGYAGKAIEHWVERGPDLTMT